MVGQEPGDRGADHAGADDGDVVAGRSLGALTGPSVASAAARHDVRRSSASSALTAGSTTAAGCQAGTAPAGSVPPVSPRRAKAATPSAVACGDG